MLGSCRFLVFGFALATLASLGWSQAASQNPAPATPTTASQPMVSGTITYRERMALPPDAAIEVKLQDVSAGASGAKTVAETVFAPTGQVPVPFQLNYNPADINPAHKYQVSANISVNGRAMFASTTPYPVITQGAPSQVAIMLQKAAPAAAPAAGAAKLRGTKWVLAEVNGTAAQPGEGKSAHFVLHSKGSLTGSTGCNNLAGTYIASEGALQITPGAMTMKACSPAVSQQEQAFLEALKATTKYTIDGSTLELLNGEQVLAKFQAEAKD